MTQVWLSLLYILLRHAEMRRVGNAGVDVFEDDLLAAVAVNDTPRKNIRSIVGLWCLFIQVLDGLVAGKQKNVVVRPPDGLHGKFFAGGGHARDDRKLIETAQPAEASANYYRFKVKATSKTTTEFVVREESPQETTYAITNITPEQIALWVRERSIDPEIEKALSGNRREEERDQRAGPEA